MKVNGYVVWLEGSQGGRSGGWRGKICCRVRKRAIGILKVNDFTEVDLGNEIVVEEKVGRGRYGE